MAPTTADLLRHILDQCDLLLGVIGRHTPESFRADRLLQMGVERGVGIMGEAAKRLPGGFRDAHPEVAWRDLRQMRNFLNHVYFAVDPDKLWANVVREIPPLKAAVERLLADATDGGTTRSSPDPSAA